MTDAPMDINVALFADPGLESCYDRPHIEIAWDQWSRTRIFCKHGVFEGISDFMDLNEGIERAMKGYRASLETGVHYCCWAETPVPESWVTDSGWEPGSTSSCDLVRGHDGEHLIFADDESEDAYWAARRVYWINGRDVTGQRPVPTPIGAPPIGMDQCNPNTNYHATPHKGCFLR